MICLHISDLADLHSAFQSSCFCAFAGYEVQRAAPVLVLANDQPHLPSSFPLELNLKTLVMASSAASSPATATVVGAGGRTPAVTANASATAAAATSTANATAAAVNAGSQAAAAAGSCSAGGALLYDLKAVTVMEPHSGSHVPHYKTFCVHGSTWYECHSSSQPPEEVAVTHVLMQQHVCQLWYQARCHQFNMPEQVPEAAAVPRGAAVLGAVGLGARAAAAETTAGAIAGEVVEHAERQRRRRKAQRDPQPAAAAAEAQAAGAPAEAGAEAGAGAGEEVIDLVSDGDQEEGEGRQGLGQCRKKRRLEEQQQQRSRQPGPEVAGDEVIDLFSDGSDDEPVHREQQQQRQRRQQFPRRLNEYGQGQLLSTGYKEQQAVGSTSEGPAAQLAGRLAYTGLAASAPLAVAATGAGASAAQGAGAVAGSAAASHKLPQFDGLTCTRCWRTFSREGAAAHAGCPDRTPPQDLLDSAAVFYQLDGAGGLGEQQGRVLLGGKDAHPTDAALLRHWEACLLLLAEEVGDTFGCIPGLGLPLASPGVSLVTPQVTGGAGGGGGYEHWVMEEARQVAQLLPEGMACPLGSSSCFGAAALQVHMLQQLGERLSVVQRSNLAPSRALHVSSAVNYVGAIGRKVRAAGSLAEASETALPLLQHVGEVVAGYRVWCGCEATDTSTARRSGNNQLQRSQQQQKQRVRLLGIDMEGANAAAQEQLGVAGRRDAGYRQVSVTQPGGLPGLLSEVAPGSGVTEVTGGDPVAARGAQLPEQVVIEAQRELLSQQGSAGCVLVHYGGMEGKLTDQGACYSLVDVAQDPALAVMKKGMGLATMSQKGAAGLFGVDCQHMGWHSAYSDAWMCLETLRGCAQGFWNSLLMAWRSRSGVWLLLEKALLQLIRVCGGQGLEDLELADARLQLMFAARREYIQQRNSRMPSAT